MKSEKANQQKEETLGGDAGNEACEDMGGARRQKEEEPASVTWMVGHPPGRCCLEKPVQQTGPQRESSSAHHRGGNRVGRGRSR